MSIAEILEQERLDTAELGRKLIDLAAPLAAVECEWLSALWEFNLRCGWADDGEVSCYDWLVSRCGLNRVTAREKVRWRTSWPDGRWFEMPSLPAPCLTRRFGRSRE